MTKDFEELFACLRPRNVRALEWLAALTDFGFGGLRPHRADRRRWDGRGVPRDLIEGETHRRVATGWTFISSTQSGQIPWLNVAFEWVFDRYFSICCQNPASSRTL